MPSRLHPSARCDAFAPVGGGSRAQAVERRLQAAIELGLVAAGEPLPAEPLLAAQFNVSTATIREALAGLRRLGLVETHRGRTGGTFVRTLAESPQKHLQDRLRDMAVDELRDLLDHHGAVAGRSAALAASRASAEDVTRMTDHVESLRHATTAMEGQLADIRLHVEIAASSHSIRLTREERTLQRLLAPLIWSSSGRSAPPRLAPHDHGAILAAIGARDADAALSLASRHAEEQIERLIERHMELAVRARRPRRAQKVTERTGRDTTLAAQALLDSLSAATAQIFDFLSTIRDALLSQRARRHREHSYRRSELAMLRPLLLAGLERHRDLVCGAGVVCAPGMLADSPRWLEWWYTAADSRRFLEVSFDPDNPDYYDYEAAEWYTRPRDSGLPSIAGPFVDHSGTDQHILTLTMPISEGDRFLGVVGADMGIDQFERVSLPHLSLIDGDVVVVNRMRRVVVSNVSRVLPATLLATAMGDHGEFRGSERTVCQNDWFAVVDVSGRSSV